MLRRNLIVAGRSLIRQPRRTSIMTIAVAIGVAALAAVSSIGESAKQDTLRRFKRMLGNVDTIIIRPGGQTRGMPTLTNVPPVLKFDDAAAARSIGGVSEVVPVQDAFDIDVTHDGASASALIFGVPPAWSSVRGEQVADGSFITDDDVRKSSRVAVLGSAMSRALFGDARPVGRTVRIAGIPFRVQGVLASRGAGPSGASLDEIVLVPITTSSQRLFRRDYLTMMLVEVSDAAAAGRVTGDLRRTLRARHHLPANALDDFNISSPSAMMSRVSLIRSTLTRVLAAVSALALLIGTGVIAGLMQLSVRERTREIGIRRAAGASAMDMMWQFLFEATLVAVCGGIAGLAMGIGAAAAMSAVQKLPLLLLSRVILLGLFVSILAGVISGTQPAVAASRVDVIRALRSE